MIPKNRLSSGIGSSLRGFSLFSPVSLSTGRWCCRYSDRYGSPALLSHNGVLNVNFSYQTTVDAADRNLFCFMTPDGLQNPTLQVLPGDHLIIHVNNNTPAGSPLMQMDPRNCEANTLTTSSVD